jgi:Zn-finger nucleic acid-binding protein
VERSGVRIDACRQCRGVWLDRGELDEILEREHRYVASAHDDDEEFLREVSGKPAKQQGYGLDAQTAMKLFKDYQSHKSSKSKRRKKSILDELFG